MMTHSELTTWIQTATAGSYLARYADGGLDADSDPGSRCGYSDETLDYVSRCLRERGLTLRTDDRGIRAEVRS